MTENKSKYVSARQLSIRTIKELEEEVAYFKENIPLLLKEIERLKGQVQEFETIGTIEEFKNLKKKSVAKKMSIGNDNGKSRKCCGNCECFVLPTSSYCSKCGQKLDWQ